MDLSTGLSVKRVVGDSGRLLEVVGDGGRLREVVRGGEL